MDALGLVDFEFFPHWNNDEKYLKQILAYLKKNKNKVCYVCNDNDGIIVKNSDIRVLGNAVKVLNGEVISIN